MTVLVIEADSAQRHPLCQRLQQLGYAVAEAATYAEAQQQLARLAPAFVLLAPELPDGDGWDLLRTAPQARALAATFVVLTAHEEVSTRLRAFALGADECLAKPVAAAELDRRMRTMARQRVGREPLGPELPRICFGEGFALDAAAGAVYHGAQLVPLTRSQFELLRCLLQHRGRALNRTQLDAALTAQRTALIAPAMDVPERDLRPNTIDVHMRNLRQALACFAPADFLETVRGIGYRIS